MPEELRTRRGRLEKLKEARARLEAKESALKEEQAKKRGRKPKPPDELALAQEAKLNLTDPESQILKTRKGWVQG